MRVGKSSKTPKNTVGCENEPEEKCIRKALLHSFNHVFNCHAVRACVGIQPAPHHKANVCVCACVRWQYNPAYLKHRGRDISICVCINLRVYQSACVSICVRRSLLKTCTRSLLGRKLLFASPGIASLHPCMFRNGKHHCMFRNRKHTAGHTTGHMAGHTRTPALGTSCIEGEYMQYTCTGHACLYRGGVHAVHAVHLHSACVPARGPVPSAMPRVAP